jgi:hypothetical protein
MMGLHYATQLYRPSRQEDATRLLACIETNLQLRFIRRATIFLDGCEAPWQREGVEFVPMNRRADFADFLGLADCLEEERSTHLLFANTDIVFDASIHQAAQALVDRRHGVCLTRRELDGSYPAGIEPMQSQDAWLVRKHPISHLLLDQLRSIRLGVAGCEHLYAAAMVAHGYSLWNPCEECIAIHRETSPGTYASQGDRYWGLYAYVPPCRLEDVGRADRGVFFSYARVPGRYYPVQIGQA